MKNIESLISDIYTNGYTIIENFIDDKIQLASLINELNAMRQKKMRSTTSNKLIDSKLIINPHASSKLFLDLISNKIITEINKKLLNDPFYRLIEDELPNYCLNFSICRSSGEDSLGWHRDDRNPPSSSRDICYTQFGLALEDSSIENGCTRIIPNTHIIPTYVNKNIDGLNKIDVIQKAGDLLIYDGRLWHAAHSNISSRTRWIFFLDLLDGI